MTHERSHIQTGIDVLVYPSTYPPSISLFEEHAYPYHMPEIIQRLESTLWC